VWFAEYRFWIVKGAPEEGVRLLALGIYYFFVPSVFFMLFNCVAFSSNYYFVHS
jgi:hypothetical protein